MKINLVFTCYELQNKILKSKICVVIDTLRATSTIITALSAGCREVVPVLSPVEALHLQALPSYAGYLLCGEVNSLKPRGFILGNSPLEYTTSLVQGQGVILATTNGTRALKYTGGAFVVVVAALLNASATARCLAKQEREVLICCAGTRAGFSIEDFVTAGKIIYELCQWCFDLKLSNSALSAFYFYQKVRDDQISLNSLFRSGSNGQRLAALGLEKDLEYCAQEDLYALVSFFDGVSIRRL